MNMISLLKTAAAVALSCITLSSVAYSAYSGINGHSIYIGNPSFSDYTNSWTIYGDTDGSVTTSGWGVGGESDIKLGLWRSTLSNAAPYAKKTLYNLNGGTYELSAYIQGEAKSSSADRQVYMYAECGGKIVKNTDVSTAWTRRSLKIDVEDGQPLTIGFVCDGGADSWYSVDDVTLVCVGEKAIDGGLIKNNSFESGLEGYTVNSGGEVTVTNNGRCGSCAYIKKGSALSVQLENIEDGLYDLQLYCKSDNADSVVYAVSGKDKAAGRIPCADDWKCVTIPSVSVREKTFKIDIVSDGELYVDDISLRKTDKPREFITGGDITELSVMESLGAQYKDENGSSRDCVELLSDNGMNMARIRVYNKTGKSAMITEGDYSYYLPEGYQDAQDALRLAKRAADSGMDIELTFHYSDFWTNGERQEIPSEWKALIDGKSDEEAVQILEKCVYDFTFSLMEQLKQQNTVPQLVSVGNEIQCGMLYPYGNVSENSDNWQNLARFLNAGARAVKDASPQSRVIIHLDDCGNFDKYMSYFGYCEAYNVNYDIIGASYYPFWSRKSIELAAEFLNSVSERFDKDTIVMETGYNFSPTRSDGYKGQLTDNGVYEDIYPATPEGHKRFMADLFNELKRVPRCLGDLYWDPIKIKCDGAGWAINGKYDTPEPNVVENTALFDFDGVALPTLKVYSDTASGAEKRDIVHSGLNGDGMKRDFYAFEHKERTTVRNMSTDDKKIIVVRAAYKDGKIDSISIDKRRIRPGGESSFAKNEYTFVWNEDTLCPIVNANNN